MKTALALGSALALSLTLAACDRAPAGAADAPADAAAPAPAAMSEALLEGDGFMPAQPAGGTGLKLSFGMAQAQVIEILTEFRGGQAPELGRNDECGAGPMEFASWGDGFQLAFQEGAFAGWWADEDAPRGYTTIHDIGVGSTLAQLRAAYPDVEIGEDSIGPEFSTGDIHGLLSGMNTTGEVTALWAGVSCIFR